MCFLIVLLLLFETEFTCSMMHRRRTQRVEENGMVPLEIEYTNSIRKFILDVASGASHYLSTLPLIMSRLGSKILGIKVYEKCDDVEPDPSVPGKFRPTESSLRYCKVECAHQNLQYVYYLQECISSILKINSFDEASSYKLEVIPIQRDISMCVGKELKVFLCHCTISYRIRVNQSLKNAVENAVPLHHNILTVYNKKADHLFTFIFLLKFHPQAAPLFLAYSLQIGMIRMEKVKTPEISESDLNLNTEVSTVAIPEGGLIDNKGSILINEDEIFRRLLLCVYAQEFNLHFFGFAHFNRMLSASFIIGFVFLILVILENVDRLKID